MQARTLLVLLVGDQPVPSWRQLPGASQAGRSGSRSQQGRRCRPDLDLFGFEQQLYLRQPVYGTSCITGKVQLEDLMRASGPTSVGDAFTLKRWFEKVSSAGIIPVSLIRWQLTGKDEESRAIVAKE